MNWLECPAEVIERCLGVEAEIQLQRRGSEYEIIYNGVFLMATYNGASEKAAIDDALKMVTKQEAGSLSILIGGLGIGYSLQETLAWDQVARVTVVELEPAVIRWNRDYLNAFNGNALADRRVNLINRNFSDLLKENVRTADETELPEYHVIMVDTDNGSSWLSIPGNKFIYSNEGLQLIFQCLHPNGTACFWSSRRETAFENRLKEYFGAVDFKAVPERTGHEGCYYLAAKSKI